MMKTIDTCGSPFSELRKNGFYYVDKSLLIKDILDYNSRGVFLFTRPRRFGKSTNLSMLDAFFNVDYKGNTWFDGLEISKFREYDEYKNSHPVIYLDLKNTECDTDRAFVKLLKGTILDAFIAHEYLLRSESISESERRMLQKVLDDDIDDDSFTLCIPRLCRMLKKHHGKGTVVLIDEYDRPVSDSFGTESHRSIMKTLGRFLTPILKGNDGLQMAYITGVMQIAKESIFSGLNNLKVNNVFSDWSDERFGFTEKEVKDLFAYCGHPEKFEEAKEWYDGYSFGNAEVYNPYCLMNYASNRFKPEPYWIDSGADTIMWMLLGRTRIGNFQDIMTLLSGGSIRTGLKASLIYAKLGRNDIDLYSLMVMSGYLKATPTDKDGCFSVSIPNKEIMGMVSDISEEVTPMGGREFIDFSSAVMDGDVERMTSTFKEILTTGSCRNYPSELYYEVVMMTVLRCISSIYTVKSEYENGDGVIDIILVPKTTGAIPIILELKKVRRKSELESAAEAAIGQIREREYYRGFTGRVALYGVSFWRKTPFFVSETHMCQ